MKKILIFSHAMELGGAERALLGLLENIDYSQYSVDLFLMRHKGELLKYIPKEVNLLEEISQYACLAVPITGVIRKLHIGIALGRIVGKFLAKRKVQSLRLSVDNGVELEYSHKYTLWRMPEINKQNYDLAISFLTPHYFVAKRVKANIKVAWIHTDYSKIDVDVNSELLMWDKYNYIVSISESVTENFVKNFPSLKQKIIKIENMLPRKNIIQQTIEIDALDEMPDDGSIRLLSIGRFCTAKNFDNIPQICKYILEEDLNVKWYIIGYGSEEALIQKKIIENGMQEKVIILGKKENPYPYIMECDVYIQPSRYEGNSVTVREAQMLGKPVVITQYATSDNQLEDGVDGIIVPMDNRGCADGIVKLLRHSEYMNRLSRNCKERDYSNMKEVEKLELLL